MAIFEGWTFAAARGASRRTLHEIADAVKIAPDALERIERTRDLDLPGGRVDVEVMERLLELYARLGFRIVARSWWRDAAVKRVQ
jgi:hypothetical protein